MTLVLDAGAFLALERRDRELMAALKRERLHGRSPRTSGAVVAQVWRGGTGRQVPVAQALAVTEVVPLDAAQGRRVGLLLGRAGTKDVVDAAVMALAVDGDDVLTSDVGDLRVLAEAADLRIDLVPV